MAKAGRINFMDYLDEKELKEIIDSELKKQIKEIVDDMRHFSFEVLWSFYLDYSPAHYARRYSLIAQGDTANSTFPRVNVKNVKNGAIIEFIYDSSIMSVFHPERYDKGERIFEGPFMQGYHGGPIFTVDSYKLDSRGKYVIDDYHYEPAPQMLPSPWERILNYARYKYGAYEI